MRRNMESILGNNPLLWCCPTVTPGSGLKYELAETDGKWIDLSALKVQDARRCDGGWDDV